MSRQLHFSIALALASAWPALAKAQSMDMQNMQNMPGMSMQHMHADDADPHAEHAASAPSAQDEPSAPHSGHDMPSMHGDTLPPNDHVPPSPPQHAMQDMTPTQMTERMQMDDAAPTGMLLFDRLERRRSTAGDYATAWEAEGWWGNAIDRVWLKTEGERSRSGTQDGRVDVLWSHAWTSFWDWQLGVRHDVGQGPSRQWAAVGVQGLAPYWFETQATFYLGEQGRTALRLESSYDLRFTQRLILAPRLELNVYGKDDPRRGVSSGLSDLQAGLRLRYEFSRKFAPYLGVDWTRRFGGHDGLPGVPEWRARETMWVAGVRLWF